MVRAWKDYIFGVGVGSPRVKWGRVRVRVSNYNEPRMIV
jgi:hypothetical protein